MLHGWALHGGTWGPWVDELASRARVHVLDLPGHGRSGWPEAVGDLHGLARAVMPAIPPGSVLLGWSLGGMIALEIARRRPRAVAALVLIATTPKFVAGEGWKHGMRHEMLDGFTHGLATDPFRTVQNFLALQARGDARGQETLRLLRSRLASRGAPDPRALEAGLSMLRDSDLRDDLPRITQPALVIAGSHDRLTPPGAGRALSEALPAARFHLVEHSGHAPFLSHAPEVLAEVLDFLDMHAAAARQAPAGA